MVPITKKLMPFMVLLYITEQNGVPSQITMWQYNPNKKQQRFVSFKDTRGDSTKGMVLRFSTNQNNFKTAVMCVIDRLSDLNPTGSSGSLPQLVVLNERQYKMLQDAHGHFKDKVGKHIVYLSSRIQDIFKYCDDADKIGLDYAAEKLFLPSEGKKSSDEYRFAAVFTKTERMLSPLVEEYQKAQLAITHNKNKE